LDKARQKPKSAKNVRLAAS